MRWIPAVALLLPFTAFAAPSAAKMASGPKEVELKAPVEVPLLRGPLTDFLPAVWGVLPAPEKSAEGTPDTGVLVVLDLAEGWTFVSPGLVQSLGLKTSKGKGLFEGNEYAVIPELRIGDLVLRDIPAVVAPPKTGGSGLVLGLATLKGTASAILPSFGTAKFVPASSAEELLNSVGTPIVAQREATKPYWEHGERRPQGGVALAIPGEILGVQGLVVPATHLGPAVLDGEHRSSWAQYPDGAGAEYGAVSLQGVALPSVWVRQLDIVEEESGQVKGAIGYASLYAADLAVDPSTNRISIRAATEVKATDPAPAFAEEALVQYAFATKPKEGAEKSEEAPKKEGAVDRGDEQKVKAESKLASALSASGRHSEALEHRAAAAAVAGDQCAPHYRYGRALLASGQTALAKTSLERAASLWDRWMAQDLETRRQLEAKKKVTGATFELAQPYECQDAWGQLAAAHLALGEYDQVLAIHKEHADLDAMLEMAAGMAHTARGDFEKANGPFRQALKLDTKDEPGENSVRLALAWSQVAAGNTKVAAAQAQEQRLTDDGVDLVALVEVARRAGGADAAAKAISDANQANPQGVGAWLVGAVESRRAGGTVDVAALKQAVDEFDRAFPFHPVAPSYRALVLVVSGDPAGAKAALDALSPGAAVQPIAYLSRALVERELGNSAGADAALAEFRMRFPYYPAAWLDLTREG